MIKGTTMLALTTLLAAGARCGGGSHEAGSRTGSAESAAGIPQDRSPGEGPAGDGASTGIPAEILAALATCEVGIGFSPGPDDPGPGLRHVSLYVPRNLRLEPPGLWPDGTPISAEINIPEDTARRLLAVLAAAGFFERATRHHTERRVPPGTPPPADSASGRPDLPVDPSVTVEVRIENEDWHRMWIGSWPPGDEVRSLVQSMESAAGGDAAAGLARLRAAF